jgi:protocatechuate 3,4-dioxygenase beta subunit
MPRSFSDITDNGVVYSDISVSSTLVGAGINYETVANVAANPFPFSGLLWGGAASVTGPNGRLDATLSYTATGIGTQGLSSILNNSVTRDALQVLPPGATLTVTTTVYDLDNNVLATSFLNATDSADPPTEITDDLPFGDTFRSVRVEVVLVATTDATVPAGSGVFFSALAQTYQAPSQPASLGDYVWHDLDADGFQDVDEPGIPGVTVELLDTNGVQIGSTTTNAAGFYQFANLASGEYSVRFVDPGSGFIATDPNAGGDDSKDSDAVGGVSQEIFLDYGEHNPTLDAGFYKLASLGDYVWEDSDRDGVQDAGEAPIAGVTVYLLNASGVQIGSTTTDGSGLYAFSGLKPGDYQVQFVTPMDYLPTVQDTPGDDTLDSDADPLTGRSQIVTLMSGEHNPTLDAGFYKEPIIIPDAGLGNYVWEDKNYNGVQDPGEDGIVGVLVELLDSNGDVIADTTTVANGFYQFIALVPGDYQVRFAPVPGYQRTFTDIGDDALDSDADAAGLSQVVNLIAGEFDPTIDAGYFRFASLGDFVWLDADADGVQDATEAGIGGVTVKLLDGTGTETGATTTTDGTGFYSFTGLTPGSYGVQFVIPSGYEVSPQDVPGDDAKDSDASPTTGKSQIVTLMSGEHNPTLDMGLYQLAGLGDFVFEDRNVNGVQDGGDIAIVGVQVNLLDAGGAVIGTTFTNGVGYYEFVNLVPGTYSVDFITPAGYIPTDANVGADDAIDSDASVTTGETAQVTLTSGAFNPTLDAGFYRLAGLGDYVWEDTDRDGIQDALEAPIAGVTVELLDTNGTPIGSTTTDGAGYYEFVGLLPGDYSVRFVTPAGYLPTLADQGGDDAADSDAVGGVTPEVTLLSGDFNPTLDAGFYRPTRSLDLEKTTDGPSNSNPVDSDYDNEDAANGAGVPILVAGTSVTWTYKVTNTGEAAFTAAEIAIVDDNGTPGSTADDMSIANGQITFLGEQSGDGDALLEAGEVWLYKASGVVQSLGGGSGGSPVTFDWSGSSALDGADGNVRSLTVGGIASKASAFSRDSGGTWSTAFLGAFGGGLGVTDSGEGDGSGNRHTVDNTTRDNYVLFTFDRNVVVDSTFLGFVVDDSDLRVWIGTDAGAFAGTPMLSDAYLAGLGFTEVNETSLTTARLADINAGNLAGNVLVIAANTGESTTEDNFKIEKITLREAGGGIYENKATLTAPGGITDSDLSHYRNGAAPKPGIDLEKTTNGPSNQNATAPTYDNEDTANGAGVPLLVAGSSVTWTYKVTNTGNTTIAKADIALVDDNGTPSNAADDMTIANGKIVFDSVQTGDADDLLEAGEVWLYKATGTVQNLTTAGSTQTFDFNGNTATDGTDGNVRGYTAGGISVKASAWSRTDGGSWASGYLGAYGGGLGVTDTGEGDGSSDKHTVDNITRDNYVLFRFDKQVIVDQAYLGYVVDDSDLTVWIGTISDAFNTTITLSDSVLSGLGFTEVNDTSSSSERWANFNAGNVAGNVLVIAASTADTTPDDEFKIEYLKVQEVSSSGIYGNKATVSVPGATDSDLSHYKNAPPPVAKIDIEKTTNGPSNSNPTAPTYDNEDAANGAGVPILTAGGAVTWTYKVANTGTTTIARADIAIVDDNGTPSSASDDMTIANGRITLLSKSVGDGDDLLEAGETWLYQATGMAKDLVAWGAATTFDMSGSSSQDGTDGNVRSYSAGGINVKANAWSRVDGTSGAWANGWLGSYGGGLGVTDRGEGDGSGDRHTVDNMGGRDNYVLFRFDQSVVLDKAYLGYVVGDSDLSVWIGNINNAYNTNITLSDSVLAGLGFKEVNNTDLTDERWADLNAGNRSGNVIVIAASDVDTSPEDRFKLDQLVVRKVPDVGVYENKATVHVPGASDSDLSHYTNPDIWH